MHRVRDQIAEPIRVRLGESEGTARKRAGELLELVGIPKKRGSAYPHELSGGMRQRAMIATALACDPAIVIGDEPTTALDVMVQAQILQLLEELRAELGLSLILITHDLSVLAETCDRVMVMYAGLIAEEGPVGRVFTAPRHPYTQKLLSSFPNIRADRRTLDVIPGMPPDLRNPPTGCAVRRALSGRDDGLQGGRATGGALRRRRPGCLSPLPARDGGHDGAHDRRDRGRRRSRRPGRGTCRMTAGTDRARSRRPGGCRPRARKSCASMISTSGSRSGAGSSTPCAGAVAARFGPSTGST